MDLEIVVLLVYHNIFLDHVDGPFFAICIFCRELFVFCS